MKNGGKSEQFSQRLIHQPKWHNLMPEQQYLVLTYRVLIQSELTIHQGLLLTDQGQVYESGFKKSDISFFTVKLLDERGLIDRSTFEFLRDDQSCSFKLLKLIDEMTDTEKRYSKYRHTREPELFFEGKGYYIARNWGVSNTPGFIKKMESKFSTLEYSLALLI